jgi:hypothetical protein
VIRQGCTLQEAAIVASVLAKVKVPLLHSAAALLKLAEMDYSGTRTVFVDDNKLIVVAQVPTRCSFVFCWTRSMRFPTKSSMDSFSTS